MRYLNYLAIAVLALAIASCSKIKSGSSNEQEEALAEINSLISSMDFPVKADASTSIADMYVRDNNLVSVIKIPTERLKALNADSIKARHLRSLTYGADAKKLGKLAVKAQLGLRYLYTNGTDTVRVSIPLNEFN